MSNNTPTPNTVADQVTEQLALALLDDQPIVAQCDAYLAQLREEYRELGIKQMRRIRNGNKPKASTTHNLFVTSCAIDAVELVKAHLTGQGWRTCHYDIRYYLANRRAIEDGELAYAMTKGATLN